MSFRLSVHQFFVGQKEITTNHFAPKIQLFTKVYFSEKDVWEFRPELWRTDCIDFGKLVILDDDIDDDLEYQENEHVQM